MKRITCVCMLLIAAAGGLLAAGEVLEEPFVPASPEVLAQGGSFVANAHGYNALFYNPAGFTVPGPPLTILGTTAWLYSNPVRFFEALGSPDPEAGLTTFLEDQLTTGGFGFGLSEGIAYVGRGFAPEHGLGLGLVLSVDSFLQGETTMGTQGALTATVGFVGGYAFPLYFLGIKLNLGADVRPMLRIEAPVDPMAMIGMLTAVDTGGDPLAALSAVQGLHGFGIGFDAGAILEMGDLRVGLAMRDILGTRFAYKESPFSDIVNPGEFLSDGTEVDVVHVIPMNLAAGVAYHLDLGKVSRFIDPTFHASLDDVIGVIREKRSVWTLVHIGTEVTVVRFLKLRAGINQGYVTFGAGMRLLFLDLNVAAFSRELGIHPGDRPNSGMTAEVAFRF
jgi:hypothetical protein